MRPGCIQPHSFSALQMMTEGWLRWALTQSAIHFFMFDRRTLWSIV